MTAGEGEMGGLVRGGAAEPSDRRDLGAPEELKWIVRVLTEHGFEAWAVGGAVRDALSGRLPGDWDVTTSAPPQAVQRHFRRTFPVGIAHGTVGVVGRSGRLYEVTTFRRDVETDGRHAKVVFSDRLEEDLARRDFTINAVAWHPLTGEVRDPFGGMDDLQRGLLRTVGNPRHRFEEDRLRVLRALRFAGTFRLTIDDDTWMAIREFADRLELLSPERVREELWKLLSLQPKPSLSLGLYAESGVLAGLYPELEHLRGIGAESVDAGSAWEFALRCVDVIPASRPTLRLAALLHPLRTAESGGAGKAGVSAALTRNVLQRLRFSNAVIDEVTHLVAHHSSLPAPEATDGDVRRWIRTVGREHVTSIARLRIAMARAMESGGDTHIQNLTRSIRCARAILHQHPPLTIGDLAVDGADLRAEGIPPGPRYGRILNTLLDHVLETPDANRKDVLLDIVRESRVD